jgi:hypothetical protein
MPSTIAIKIEGILLKVQGLVYPFEESFVSLPKVGLGDPEHSYVFSFEFIWVT